jgi:hypothetical protein
MTTSEWNLSPEEEERLRQAVDELDKQAEFYGMDTDLETWSLVPKRLPPIDKTPWLTRYIERLNQSDNHYAAYLIERE